MKYKLLSLFFLVVFIGCSDEDEALLTNPEISFIRENGAILTNAECINPNENYSLQIRVVSNKIGDFQPTSFEYTLNGALFSVTFTNEETKTIRVNLIEGENIAQLVSTGSESRISIVTQEDFVLVD